MRRSKALGGNDGNLATKKKQLKNAKSEKASDEEFLDELLPMCKKKAEGYANRKVLRANEEAAVAEAISILNSDDAFAAFGKTDATSTGGTGFIQLRSVRKHITGDVNTRSMAQKVLQQAAKDAKSSRLTKVAALLQADNPFASVLDEIDKMLDLITEEGKSDKENLDFCNKERKENNDSLRAKKKAIDSLNKKIDDLDDTINNPKTGLKAQIADTEQSLLDNTAAQKTETAERTESNVAYQQDIKNLVAAEEILSKAIKVLNAYYEDGEEAGVRKSICSGEEGGPNPS